MVDFRSKLGLWSKSVRPNAGHGRRFVKIVRTEMKAHPGSCQYTALTKTADEITEDEKVFWTNSDKCWAWHQFLIGGTLDFITEMVGGKPEDFSQWVEGVCSGQESCLFRVRFKDWQWTPRKDKILLKMYEARLPLDTASRLLAFDVHELKKRIRFLK